MTKNLSKKQKIAIGVSAPIVALIAAFLILCIVTMSLYSPVFLGRVLTHWDSSVSDYKVFPKRDIQKSQTPYKYDKNINPTLKDMEIKCLLKEALTDQVNDREVYMKGVDRSYY